MNVAQFHFNIGPTAHLVHALFRHIFFSDFVLFKDANILVGFYKGNGLVLLSPCGTLAVKVLLKAVHYVSAFSDVIVAAFKTQDVDVSFGQRNYLLLDLYEK